MLLEDKCISQKYISYHNVRWYFLKAIEIGLLASSKIRKINP